MVSVRGFIMFSCGVMGCSSECIEVIIIFSGGFSWVLLGWVSWCSVIR